MKVNPFAEQFRQALERAVPELRWHSEQSDAGNLRLSVAHASLPMSLVAQTEDEDISVGILGWHTHGDILAGTTSIGRTYEGNDDREAEIRASVALVRGILGDSVRLVARYVDGKLEDVCPGWEEDVERYEHKAASERFVVGYWSELGSDRQRVVHGGVAHDA